MTLMSWRPHRDLSALAAEMNRMMGNVESDRRDECLMGNWVPPVDIYEDQDKVEMTFELPGVDKQDLDVEIHAGTLAIRGSRKLEREENQDRYRRIERSYGSFCRNFTLPDRIVVDQVSAAFKDGLLILTLPKTEEAKPRKVAVTVK